MTFRAAGTSLSGQAVTDSVLIVLGDGWTLAQPFGAVPATVAATAAVSTSDRWTGGIAYETVAGCSPAWLMLDDAVPASN